MNLCPEVQAVANWLQSQISPDTYGEVGIKLIIHAGSISKIEKLLIEKTKPS